MSEALHDQLTEQALLGGIFTNPNLIFETDSIITSDDFYLPSHRDIYRTMGDLSANGESIDFLTVHNRLKEKKIHVGGLEYILDLTKHNMRLPSLANQAKRIRDKAQRRRTRAVMESALSSCEDASYKTREIIAETQDKLLAIDAETDRGEIQSIHDMTLPELNAWEKMRNLPSGLIGLSFGIDCLDAFTTGLRDGEMTVIGGSPGMGKSSLGLQAIRAAAEKEIPCAFFSWEMRRNEILHRLWAVESNVFYFRIHNPKECDDFQRTRVMNAASKIASWPVWIEDDGKLTVSQAVARARLLIRRHKLKLIVFDFAQRFTTDQRDRDMRAHLTRVSRGISALCHSEGIPVILLSQLSRPKDNNPNHRPSMFDLKESGTLEEDAHNVLLLFRPEKDSKKTGNDEIIIGKQRNGPTGSVEVSYDGNFLTYGERTC